MKMALDNPGGSNSITAYEPGQVRVRDQTYTRSLIVMPQQVIEDWQPVSAEELQNTHFRPLLDDAPEVVIIGTGDQQLFPDPAVFMTLMDMGIGYEVMDNSAACRTYNILLAEDRKVALALIIPHT